MLRPRQDGLHDGNVRGDGVGGHLWRVQRAAVRAQGQGAHLAGENIGTVSEYYFEETFKNCSILNSFLGIDWEVDGTRLRGRM